MHPLFFLFFFSVPLFRSFSHSSAMPHHRVCLVHLQFSAFRGRLPGAFRGLSTCHDSFHGITHVFPIAHGLSTQERIQILLKILSKRNIITFSKTLQKNEGKKGVVVTLLASLELAKDGYLELIQNKSSELFLKSKGI